MIFKETQKFNQWWLWIILIGIGVLLSYNVYQNFTAGEMIGNMPNSPVGNLLLSILFFVLIAMFWFIQLETEIDQKQIKMRFFPFITKRIDWADVQKAEVLNYGFVGGWGIRIWTQYGTVYNIKGNKGLALELKNGKKILIGTQKEAELQKVIEHYSRLKGV